MKILVFGKSGQVAQSLSALNSDDLTIVAIGRGDLDLSRTQDLEEIIASHAPDAIINAAAYTAVDKAETELAAADALNHTAVAALGHAAKVLDIPLVHISTDYVFDGSGHHSRVPSEATGPLGAYGRTKLAGEEALQRIDGRYAVLRTSWVFSAFGNNFVKTMLRLGKERDQLSIIADQIGGPTCASDIAQATLEIAQHLIKNVSLKGIWHFSGADDCSWADFATEIFSQAHLKCSVTPIPTSDYPTPAVRPLNSRLDCTSTRTDFGIERPSWKHSLTNVLKELGEIR